MKDCLRLIFQTPAVLALAGIQVFSQSVYTPYTFSTLAGKPGSVIGSPEGFYRPMGVALDKADNIYVADSFNHAIRKVTPAGVMTTLAGLLGEYGSTDGTGTEARFNGPFGVAVDSGGNVIVADAENYTLRRVTPAGVVTTLAGLAGSHGTADGTGSDARFGGLFYGVAVDSADNIYVADYFGYTIRKVTPSGTVTTLAGLPYHAGATDGTGSDARFFYPFGVAVDSAGDIYVTDATSDIVRKVSPAGVVTTLAGLAGNWGTFDEAGHFHSPVDGKGNVARFHSPAGVAVDRDGNIYVTEIFHNNTIRKITPDGMVTTLAGLPQFDKLGNELTGYADGTGSTARFSHPAGVAVDSAGNIYVADSWNNMIRKGYPAPRFLNSPENLRFSDEHFGVSLTGPTGRLVIVEASADLVNWVPLRTNTFANDLKISDPQSSVYSNRFYRAQLPLPE